MGSAQARDAQQVHGAGNPLLLRLASPLCKVPAASRLDWGGGLSVGQGVVATLLLLLLPSGFVVFSAKARGFCVCPWEACGGTAAPAGPASPSPKVLCLQLPLAGPSSLPPSVHLSVSPSCRPRWRTLALPLSSQLLKAIVSIACSSLLRSRCLRACSSFSNAAKIWGERARER